MYLPLSELWPFAPNLTVPLPSPPSPINPQIPSKYSFNAMAHVHPIPFPPAPVPHQPSPLSFGFAFPRGTHGFGSTSSPSAPAAAGPSSTFGSPLRRPQPQTAFSSPSFPVNGQGSPSVGFGFGSPAALGSTSRPTAQFQRHSSTGSPTVNRRRGRDDLSDEDDDEQDERDQREVESVRPMRGMKKSKMDPFGTVASSSATDGPSAASTSSSSSSQASNEEPDLGVLLGACHALSRLSSFSILWLTFVNAPTFPLFSPAPSDFPPPHPHLPRSTPPDPQTRPPRTPAPTLAARRLGGTSRSREQGPERSAVWVGRPASWRRRERTLRCRTSHRKRQRSRRSCTSLPRLQQLSFRPEADCFIRPPRSNPTCLSFSPRPTPPPRLPPVPLPTQPTSSPTSSTQPPSSSGCARPSLRCLRYRSSGLGLRESGSDGRTSSRAGLTRKAAWSGMELLKGGCESSTHSLAVRRGLMGRRAEFGARWVR